MPYVLEIQSGSWIRCIFPNGDVNWTVILENARIFHSIEETEKLIAKFSLYWRERYSRIQIKKIRFSIVKEEL